MASSKKKLAASKNLITSEKSTSAQKKTTYIIDTSALIHDPNVYRSFPAGSVVVLPIATLTELDKLKKGRTDVAKSARVCIRALDAVSDMGDISVGVVLEEGITLRVDAFCRDIPPGFGPIDYGDTHILTCAHWHHQNIKAGERVVLVSNDINLRVKAKANGMEAEGVKGDKQSLTDLYQGLRTIVNAAAGEELRETGFVDPYLFDLKDLHPQECVIFTDEKGKSIAMGRKSSNKGIKSVRSFTPWGLHPLGDGEQKMAIDMLMDPGLDLVSISGIAGTGKSLLICAAALELVLNRKLFEKVLFIKALIPCGEPVGFLPGFLEEKINPYFQSVMDSFEFLFSNKSSSGQGWKRDLEMYQEKGRISFETMAFMRGRSLQNSLIVIEEAQNITKNEIKTLLSRISTNSRVFLCGDLDQIDHAKLSDGDNGLIHVIDGFKDYYLAGHINLVQGERSRLATLSAEIL